LVRELLLFGFRNTIMKKTEERKFQNEILLSKI